MISPVGAAGQAAVRVARLAGSGSWRGGDWLGGGDWPGGGVWPGGDGGPLTRRGRAGTRLKQQEQGRQHESPLAGECGRERGWGQGGGERAGGHGRFFHTKAQRHEVKKARRAPVAAARDAVKREALRRAGVGYVEAVAGDTPAELRRVVEWLVRAI